MNWTNPTPLYQLTILIDELDKGNNTLSDETDKLKAQLKAKDT